MKHISNHVLWAATVLPLSGVAVAADSSAVLSGHWDSFFFVALGVWIVWREVNSSKRGGAGQGRSGWGALNSWQRPARNRSGLLPVLAKLTFRRFRR